MKRAFAMILVVAMALSLLAGCVAGDPKDTTPAPAADKGDKITITWYHGSKELKSEQVDKGTTLKEWAPEAGDGKEFVGWFAEASLTDAFDFSKPVDKDTDIFAAFKSNVYVEDTNNYYAIGAGAGDMSQSGWDHAKSEAALSFTKDETVTDKNVYTITLKMYAGDGFQICYGGVWDGQQGIGHMVGAEYADGVNKYDHTEYTAADKKYAVVKDEAGNVIFEGSDEYNKEFFVWNIFVAEGQDGVYKFTYTTNPETPGYNTLEWELVEKLEPMTNTHEMYLIGAFNEWTESDANYSMSKSEDGSYWTGFLTVTPEMYVDYGQEDKNTTAFKVFNGVNGAYLDNAGGENMFLSEGTYCIKYTVEGDVIEIQKLDYYIVGTLLDADGNAVNFAVKEGVSPKLENGTVTFDAYDATGNNNYTWMVDQGKPGVMAIKVVFGCELGIKDWYSDDANGGDNFYINAGSVTVSLVDGVVTVTQ